jgi:uncharacterized membrane protein YozB (DUF420 family)
MIAPAFFPALNATLNGASAVLIASGVVLIRRQHRLAHKRVMLSAVLCSALFLTSYLYYHLALLHGHPTHFQGSGLARSAYFSILGSHTVLAVVIVPLVLVTVRRGLGGRYSSHRASARWTYPLWMYVSVTGVVIYLMLYHLFAG